MTFRRRCMSLASPTSEALSKELIANAGGCRPFINTPVQDLRLDLSGLNQLRAGAVEVVVAVHHRHTGRRDGGGRGASGRRRRGQVALRL